MSKDRHTPGPWKLKNEPFSDGKPYFIIETGGGYYDLDTRRAFRIAAIMSEADANLIAAAPDLKAASTEQAILIEGAQAILTLHLLPSADGISAEEAINRLLAHLDGPDERRVKALHVAAIAKAEGRKTPPPNSR